VIFVPYKNPKDHANYMRKWRTTEIRKRETVSKKEYRLLRKKEAVALKGGKCTICGYNKNIAALEFHHINGKDISWKKERNFLRWRYDKFIEELEKCTLVCSNCHVEIHHPQYLNI
jgi:hypothetical protein